MKILNLFKPFRTATILNIAGLTIAFASFMIIMMQVSYEQGFDKHYSESEKIFIIEKAWNDQGDNHYVPWMNRPLVEQILTLSPEIRAGGLMLPIVGECQVYETEKGPSGSLLEEVVLVTDSLHAVFDMKIIAGDAVSFSNPEATMIAQSTAKRFFGNEDPIGRLLTVITDGVTLNFSVAAVFEDLPKNSSIPNCIHANIGDINKGVWGNNGSRGFLKLDTPESSARLGTLFSERFGDRPELFNHSTLPSIKLINLAEYYFHEDNITSEKGSKTTTSSLAFVAILIIIVAIINYFNFSLALIPKRIKGINIRKTLGSATWSLRAHQLYESLGITLLAVILSFIIVFVLSRSSFTSLISADMSLTANIVIVLFTIALASLAALLAAIYPAVYSTSFSPAMVLKGSFGVSPRGRRLRSVLIGTQYVVSLTLIMVALFAWRQYGYMRSYDIGMRSDNVLVTRLTTEMDKQRDVLVNTLKEHPDIEDAAFSFVPAVATAGLQLGREYEGNEILFRSMPVSPNFLSVMGIKITDGRDFIRDDESKEAGSYIFNTKARQAFALELGHTVGGYNNTQAEIIGFSDDFNFRPLHYQIEPFAFYIWGNENKWGPMLNAYIKVTNRDVESARDHIMATLSKVDPAGASLATVEPLNETLGTLYNKESNLASLVTLFSLLVVLISTAGAFGLVMFETQYRRKEIGLRKVFGAAVTDILKMFNIRYIRIVIVCFVIASPLAYYAAVQWQDNFVYKAPLSACIFFTALLIILFITVATVTLQSFNAATDNPVNSIKAE